MAIDFTGMEPITESIVIYMGSTLDTPYEFLQEDGITPYNFTGCSAEMHIRQTKDAATTLEEWTTVNGKLTLSALGILQFNVTDEQTSVIAWSGPAFYDLEIEDTLGARYRIFEGIVTISTGVTR